MFVVIRVDATNQMGSGHVMRCIALAESLIEKQHRVVFVCSCLMGNLIEVIRYRGFEVWSLPSEKKYLDNKEWDWQEDACDTCKLIAEHKIKVDWVFIDHYLLDARWHALVSTHVSKVAVLDDLADRPHFCDLLVDQNSITLIHERYNTLVPAHCIKLMGPRYTLLRKEFSQVSRARLLRQTSMEELGPIVIFMGGADSENNTLKVLKAINASSLCLYLHVLIGPMNQWRPNIVAWCQDKKVEFTVANNEVGELLTKSRAAIVACGMFAVELQALEIPCILVPLSDIQRTVACYFSEHGRALMLSPENLSNPDILTKSICKLLSLPYVATGQGVVPVDGAHEIVRCLERYK